jgi:hypothetical protein
LPWDGTSPVLVWPAQPGLQFVLGAPLATAQATLLGGEVREAAAVIADLEASRPPVAVLGSGRGLVPGVTNLHGLQPELWSYLRHHYQRVTEHPSARESFWVATRLTDRRGQGPPHDARLPGSAQEVATGSTPVLGPGVGLGQTFRVVDFDLAGVEMMFRAPGPYPYPVAFTLTFHEIVGATGTRPLTSFPLQIQLEKRTQKVMFSFPPLAGTAGKVLLMEIAADPAASAPFRLLWNRKNAEVPRFVDYYPEGQAFLDNRPLAADLFFVTY